MGGSLEGIYNNNDKRPQWFRSHEQPYAWTCIQLSLHIKYKLLFSYLRKHAKYLIFIIIINLQNEEPNYNGKKEILVLGKSEFDYHTCR